MRCAMTAQGMFSIMSCSGTVTANSSVSCFTEVASESKATLTGWCSQTNIWAASSELDELSNIQRGLDDAESFGTFPLQNRFINNPNT